MSSTNPFDDEEESPKGQSTNPFEDEGTNVRLEKPAVKQSSTNPFEDEDKEAIPPPPPSTNPFQDGDDSDSPDDGPQLPSSTNPFEDDDDDSIEEPVRNRPGYNPFDESFEMVNPSSPGGNDESAESQPRSLGEPLAQATMVSSKGTSAEPPMVKATLIPDSASSAAHKTQSTRTPKASAPLPETPTGSVTKVLSHLLSIPTNRSCADCHSLLMDSSQVMASFSTSLGKLPHQLSSEVSLGSFQDNHTAFAPPSATPTPHKKKAPSDRQLPPSVDPAIAVVHYTGGHGVFLCSACGTAHNNALDSDTTTVRYVQGAEASWSTEQVQFMARAGGNARSWTVYEAYMPDSWQQERPTSASILAERELFCRAKYEALAFVTPLGGPLADTAWLRLLEKNKSAEFWDKSEEFHHFRRISIHESPSKPETFLEHSASGIELPGRLVDFFCVIGHNGRLSPASQSTLNEKTLPDELMLDTDVIDCYPEPNAHAGFDFPEHISKFVYPDGCRPRETRMAPIFFSFVLTSSSGTKLYGAALHVYDESTETEELMDVMKKSDYDGTLPDWEHASDIVFIPKCLVVISHYGFFNLWRSFLLQLYRVTLVEAPLPIERYIANFVSEVPLPPQGQIKVKFAITDDQVCTISRPAMNELPLADFSYVPLFASLSVENIMVVMACLMQEQQVALVCRHYSMLAPVAEALVSFLFPFEWQGIYIPVMPYSMQDILDAPIPFLVGVHGRYLSETTPTRRPHGVVFVDIDNDVVHLGFDPTTEEPRLPPCLPERDALKLKSKLQKYGSMVYMSATRNTYVKARMTTGNGEVLIDSVRPGYAQSSSMFDAAPATTRLVALAKTEKAYDDLLTPISGFATENGQLSEVDTVQQQEVSKSRKMKSLFRKKLSGVSAKSMSSEEAPPKKDGCLLDDKGPERFSTYEIRHAWLRFFVSIYRNYESFVGDDAQPDMFLQEDFLNDLDCSHDARLFMVQVTSSQMFQRYVEVKVTSSNDPYARFFDESILAKQNRSRVTTLTTGGKKETPFLDGNSGEIRETFTPAPPSNWGLPDYGEGYSYPAFPKLDQELFGKVRPPKQWPQEQARAKQQKTKFLSKQQEIFAKAMKPLKAPLTPVSNMAKKVTRDVEWAIVSLSCKTSPRQMFSQKEGAGRGRFPRSKGPEEETISAPDSTFRGAEELVISARRKQGLLLGIAVKVQALCRMYIWKTRYQKYKKAIVCLQRRHRLGYVKTEETDLMKSKNSALLLQRVARGVLARRQAKLMLKSILLLQRRTRGARVRGYMKRLRGAAVLLQSLKRGRRVRFGYSILRHLISKVQARIRGFLTRKWLRSLIETRMSKYRQHVVDLWHRAYTPLAFRTKFWRLVATETKLLHYNLIEDELDRLWGELGVTFASLVNESNGSTEKLSERLVGRSYGKYMEAQGTLAANGQEGEESSALLPAQVGDALQPASERLQLEKLQLYEKLNSCKDKNLLASCYGAFDISANEKGKKARLIEEIWTCYDYADGSVMVMMSLFPELRTSSDIHCNVTPSKKGQRRVLHGKTCQLTPLDESMDINLKVDNRIKANMREFATARFNTTNRRRSKSEQATLRAERFSRQKNAIMQARGKSWSSCQHEIVMSLLYPGSSLEGC